MAVEVLTAGQLSLKLIQRLPYAAETFCLHDGVQDVFKKCKALLTKPDFCSIFICSSRRAGKTHLAVALADYLSRVGFLPRLLDGIDGAEIFATQIDNNTLTSADVVLIDCFEEIFSAGQEMSGAIVSLYEALRRVNGKLLLFSSKAVVELSTDDHVRSRLHAGPVFELGCPEQRDMSAVIRLMALQRGLTLSSRAVEFLARHLRREIPQIEACLEETISLAQRSSSGVKFRHLRAALQRL